MHSRQHTSEMVSQHAMATTVRRVKQENRLRRQNQNQGIETTVKSRVSSVPRMAVGIFDLRDVCVNALDRSYPQRYTLRDNRCSIFLLNNLSNTVKSIIATMKLNVRP